MNNITVVLTLTDEDDKKYSKSIVHKYTEYPIVISKVNGLGNARRDCIDRVVTDYTLVLDADTVLPDCFVEHAIMIMNCDSKTAVVALDYEKCQGHYAFGVSMWRTEILKKLYDYQNYSGELCECIYMYHKVLQSGYAIETLPYRAIHLKGVI